LDAGFGIRYNKIAIDYAYSPHEYFSSTHTFSVVFAPSADGRSRTYREEEAREATPSANQTNTQAAEPVQTAPVVDPASDPRTQPVAPVETPTAVAYLVVAGIHGWESSARAEARSYEVLDIPASVERFGDKYRVVVGRYDTHKDAVKALNKFKKSGQSFTMIEVPAK
jgi:cell division protein FtsN